MAYFDLSKRNVTDINQANVLKAFES